MLPTSHHMPMSTLKTVMIPMGLLYSDRVVIAKEVANLKAKVSKLKCSNNAKRTKV